eukprot:g15656.t1
MEETRKQLEQQREEQALVFKPFVVEGEDDTVASLEGAGTTTILHPPPFVPGSGQHRPRTKQRPSPPGIIVAAHDYDASKHKDVEEGVGKASQRSSADTEIQKKRIRCLTLVLDVPHGSKAELKSGYLKLGVHFWGVPVAMKWQKEASDCVRWRMFPVEYWPHLDGMKHLGRRNVWQLQAFFPKWFQDRYGMLCLNAFAPHKSLTLFPCKALDRETAAAASKKAHDDTFALHKWLLKMSGSTGKTLQALQQEAQQIDAGMIANHGAHYRLASGRDEASAERLHHKKRQRPVLIAPVVKEKVMVIAVALLRLPRKN